MNYIDYMDEGGKPSLYKETPLEYKIFDGPLMPEWGPAKRITVDWSAVKYYVDLINDKYKKDRTISVQNSTSRNTNNTSNKINNNSSISNSNSSDTSYYNYQNYWNRNFNTIKPLP